MSKSMRMAAAAVLVRADTDIARVGHPAAAGEAAAASPVAAAVLRRIALY
ncbi:MAG: hypothetical protein HFG45_09940 [Oscillospiraceae bacterium]|nr:hypothetical protein [Oscillospiraceae bacterium]